MTDYVKALALLPADEARDLAIKAAERGVTTPEWIGFLVLLSAYGPMHSEVLAFMERSNMGQSGPREG